MDSPDGAHRVTGSARTDPAHAARRSPTPAKSLGVAAGAVAVMLTAGLAITALLKESERTTSGPASARLITVSPAVGLPASEVGALTGRAPELGPLADPGRLASCLQGLGRPAVPVLGARTVELDGGQAVVLVFPGSQPSELLAVAVRADCSATNPARVADTTVTAP